MMKQKDFLSILFFASALPFILFFVSPVSFYLGNHNEFTTNLSDDIRLLLEIGAGITAILVLLLILIFRWPFFYKLVCGLLVGLAISTWVQSQLFAWNFGPFDGHKIKWSDWAAQADLEMIVWAAILSVAVILSFRKKNIINALAKSILFLGALTLLSNWFLSDYKPKIANGAVAEHFFSFHEENNKILIVLDTFQSDIFNEIAQEWPEEVEFLRGFIYYPNTVGGYPTTKTSIPLIMTGQFYKNEIPMMDWILKQNKANNLADFHLAKNYGVSLVSLVPSTLAGVKAPTAFIGDFANTNQTSIHNQALLVLDGGLFRALPTNLKPKLYNEGNWFFYHMASTEPKEPGMHGDDLRFLKNFEEKIKIRSTHQGEFKLYHYAGAHLPYDRDEFFEYDKDMPENKDSYVRQARGVLRILRRKLERIQQLGIYDSAEILVIGDHGMIFMPTDMQQKTEAGLNNDLDKAVLGAARPLFLHKPSMSTGTLESSDKALHLADIPCILSQNDHAFACADYLASTSNANRKRRFLSYHWNHQDWEKKYMPPMTEYLIQGDVRDLASWQNQYLEYNKGSVLRLSKYKLGLPVNFGQHGNAEKYLKQGWSGQEEKHRWTDASKSRLILNVDHPKSESLSLRVLGSGFPAKNKAAQQVDVLVNGVKVTTWQMSNLDWYEALIPATIINNGLLNIEFVIAEPTAPCEVSKSDDCRKLGMKAEELIVDQSVSKISDKRS